MIRVEEIVSLIKAGGQSRRQGIKQLVSNKSLIRKLMGFGRNAGLNREDSEEMKQEVLLQTILNIEKGNFRSDGNLENYIMGVARYTSYRFIEKKRKRSLSDSIQNKLLHHEPNELETKECESLIHDLLSGLGSTCKKVLKLWASGYKMEEIRQMVNLSSTGAARKKKHDCMI